MPCKWNGGFGGRERDREALGSGRARRLRERRRGQLDGRTLSTDAELELGGVPAAATQFHLTREQTVLWRPSRWSGGVGGRERDREALSSGRARRLRERRRGEGRASSADAERKRGGVPAAATQFNWIRGQNVVYIRTCTQYAESGSK